MKYTININQKALVELAPDITYDQAAVLDYLMSICLSDHKNIEAERQNGFTWVDYRHLLKQMPLLKGKTKITVTAKLNKLKEYGFIETMIINRGYQQKRKYVKLTDKCNFLYSEEGHPINPEFYNLFKEIGMNENQARIVSSDVDCLQEKQNDFMRVINLKGTMKGVEDRGAYIWDIYQEWKRAGI